MKLDLINDTRYFLECALVDFVTICGCLTYAERDEVIQTCRLNGDRAQATPGVDRDVETRAGRQLKESPKMNPLLRFALGLANVRDKEVTDLEKELLA